MFFYLLVGASLLLKRVKLRLCFSLGALLALSILGVLPSVVVYFAWGIVGNLVEKSKITVSKTTAAWLALSTASLLAFQVAWGMQVYPSVAILGLEVAILFYALSQTWQIKSQFLGLLGDSSYAQYLLHVPVLTILVSIFANRMDNFALIVVCFLVVNVTAIVAWNFLDRPLGKFGRSLFSGS
jgi:peptidoglycan/LPS O-acetylase OafA/YrhL